MNNLSNAKSAFENFNEFLDQLVDKTPVELVLEFTASEMNGQPVLVIEHNNVTLYNEPQSAGIHTVKIDLPYADNNILKISMVGKNSTTDTEIINGEITRDKFITFNNIVIDSFDLYNDTDFYYNCFQYRNNNTGILETVNHGFWANSTLSLEFELPFVTWYNSKTTKNINLATDLRYRQHSQTEKTLHQLISTVNKLL